MEKRDYLLRQIEALGRILSRLRGLIVGGDTAAADSEIREEMRNVGHRPRDGERARPGDAADAARRSGARLAACVHGRSPCSTWTRFARAPTATITWAAAKRGRRAGAALGGASQLDGERGGLADQLIAEIRGASTASPRTL